MPKVPMTYGGFWISIRIAAPDIVWFYISEDGHATFRSEGLIDTR